MKFVDEYRDAEVAQGYARAIARQVTRPWTIMEICGGQTHTIVKYGVDTLLPKSLTLVHGPGCPVCVTPIELIDKAVEIASRPDVIFCSFGDMLRVPGTTHDLLTVKARGGDVRIVYSPLDTVRIAKEHPDKQIVFFAVGFETTAPANAMAVAQARREGLTNFSMLVSHVLVPPAMEAILSSPQNRVQGFLAAGHVCAVMGYAGVRADRRQVPRPHRGHRVRAGGRLPGHRHVRRAARIRPRRGGEPVRPLRPPRGKSARPAIDPRGLPGRAAQVAGRGRDPGERSGSAATRTRTSTPSAGSVRPPPGSDHTSECQSGLVLQGVLKPHECPAFGTRCTPERPLGAPMVSSEGACAAYYRYRRMRDADASTVEPRS